MLWKMHSDELQPTNYNRPVDVDLLFRARNRLESTLKIHTAPFPSYYNMLSGKNRSLKPYD